ncbi:MAG: hypothetical protein ABII90_09955 [Bacteroidota bacterium]
MQSPEKLNGENIAMLADVIAQFPYCQTAHLLYLKNLHTLKSIHYNHQLRIASTYTSDRKKLYELVMQPVIISKITQIEETTTVTTEDKKRKEITRLEKQILKEAIDASIQLEVAERDGGRGTEDEGKGIRDKEQGTGDEGIQSQLSQKRMREGEGLIQQAGDKTEKSKRPFSEWLKRVDEIKRKDSIGRIATITGNELINKFIKENPQIASSSQSRTEGLEKEFFSPVNTARLSVIDEETFVTETLADIYIKQKLFSKAIKAYEILSLKYPEKSSNFAAIIKSLQKFI